MKVAKFKKKKKLDYPETLREARIDLEDLIDLQKKSKFY